MTDQQHPITPPPELVQQWVSLACEYEGNETWIDLATQAARWGADQELEWCINYFLEYDTSWSEDSELITGLRAARRPKPPSLKEQALALVEQHEDGWRPSPKDWDIIRRALEQLDD